MSEKTTWPTSTENTSSVTPDDIVTEEFGGLHIVYIVIGIIGFFGNLIVVIVIATSQSLRKRHTNWFLINQSVVDLLTAVMLAGQAYKPTIRISGIGGFLYCKLWYTSHFLWTFALTSTYNLMMITLERYVAIVHPIWHKNHISWKKSAVAMVIPWLVGVSFNIFTPVVAKIILEECLTFQFRSLLESRALGIAAFIVQFALPLVFMIVCYVRIALVFTDRRQPTGSNATSTKLAKSRNDARVNILVTFVSVCVAFVLCWSWNQVFFLLFNVGVAVSFTSYFYLFSVGAAHANCAINPFIYAAKYTEFRRAFVRLVRRGKVGTEGDGSTVDSVA